METPQSILEFWFGDILDPVETVRRQSSLWTGKSHEMDVLIGHRYTQTLIAAEQGELDGWLDRPEGRLALIIVTGQFPRCIYRGRARAYAFDTLAWRWCTEGLESGEDRKLLPVHRLFYYAPLMHSEAVEDQLCAVSLYHRLAYEVPITQRAPFEDFLDRAKRRRSLIEHFGRFPHRNGLLGRASTPEEVEYLQRPGNLPL